MARTLPPPEVEEIAGLPFTWMHFANILGSSAELVWKHSVAPARSAQRRARGSRRGVGAHIWALERRRVFLLLAGLAVENMIKGILVKQLRHAGQAVVVATRQGTKELLPSIARHGLNALADQANFARTEDERDLLERLTHYVEWGGRYPVGKRTTVARMQKSWVIPRGDSEWKQVERLARRLKRFYEALPGDDGTKDL